MTSWPTDAPTASQVEVSLFGPGRGESCVVHVGDGTWLVIDSCRDQRTGHVPALQYLAGIGVDVATDVRCVVGTHAHGDHIAGLAEVYEACGSARLVIPQALSSREYLELVEVASPSSPTSGAHLEYRRAFAEARRRGREGRPSLRYAAESRYLLERRQGDTADVRVLSPGDEAITRSLLAIEAARPRGGEEWRSAPRDLNDCSIALWVETDDVCALLGADLLAGPRGCGWSAVVQSFTPDTPATYVKLPHHGAPNAHHDGMWDELLATDSVAALTPFRGGHQPRPSEDDVERITGRTRFAYATAAARAPKLPQRIREEVAELQAIAATVRDPWGECGLVRARHNPTSARWTTQLFGPARQLHGSGVRPSSR